MFRKQFIDLSITSKTENFNSAKQQQSVAVCLHTITCDQ